MPVFYFLVILSAVLLWFLLAFAYRPVGKFFKRLWNESLGEMSKEDKDNKKEMENENE